jgi:Icc-related predicted phosphoesterase
MRVLFASDIHGSKGLYEQLFALAASVSADCVLLGGDLLPTRIASPKVLLSAGEDDFQACLQAQHEFIDLFLAPELNRFMNTHPSMSFVYIPGNHDWIAAMDHLGHSVPRAINVHGRSTVIGEAVIIGYGCVTDSTFWVKDFARRDLKGSDHVPSRFALVSDTDRLRFSPDGSYALLRPSMEEDLARMEMPEPHRTICLFHCPPFDTGLDTLHNGKPIGSRAIRQFIARNQPWVSLHGHIHESPYMSGRYVTENLGSLSINPGRGPKELHAAVFDAGDPSGTLRHSVFADGKGPGGTKESLTERRMRKIKALLMETLLKGT